MSIDRSEDASRQDAVKELQDALAAEKRKAGRWEFATLLAGAIAAKLALACVVLVICAKVTGGNLDRARADAQDYGDMAARAIRNTAEAIRIADAYRDALEVERVRYRACVSDRETCMDVGHGWTLCMPGGER